MPGACDWPRTTPPDAELLAFRAWFAATLAEPIAADLARAVLACTLDDSLPWRLAIGALYRCGAEAEGAAEITRARRDPVRRDWARAVSGKHARPEAVYVPWAHPRTEARGLGGAVVTTPTGEA